MIKKIFLVLLVTLFMQMPIVRADDLTPEQSARLKTIIQAATEQCSKTNSCSTGAGSGLGAVKQSTEGPGIPTIIQQPWYKGHATQLYSIVGLIVAISISTQLWFINKKLKVKDVPGR